MTLQSVVHRGLGACLMIATGCLLAAQPGQAAPSPKPPARAFGALPAKPLPGDRMLDEYFARRTREIETRSLADIKTLEDWTARKDEYRRQLAEMLGLWPTPAKTDLKPVITGKVEHPEFIVENLHYQSMPGLYVTGNLYLPRNITGKLPAILYVCGHSNVKDPKTGRSLGNKTGYQHHGEWFARNGYVCLTIDTVQLGEIPGAHHGLYNLNQWWWINRGYSSSGAEAWNSIRGIDYLQSRPEVDGDRIGITGRSGGGAYSWWAAALDERVKVAVPVAGITDMHNHVVDGVIEGHCDCMFMTNTYRWDFAQVAALVAPRPLLISNTDKDSIFPLDGVQRLHAQVRDIYRLHRAEDQLGLLITEGPHLDTQDLQVPAFRWFNRFLKNDKTPVKIVAEKLLEPTQLQVFKGDLPADERSSKIQHTFVPKAPEPAVPADAEAWARQRDTWLSELKKQSFAAWPDQPLKDVRTESFTANNLSLQVLTFESQPDGHGSANTPVSIHIVSGVKPGKEPPNLVVLNIVEHDEWLRQLATFKPEFGKTALKDIDLPEPNADERESTLKMLAGTKWAMAYVAVRGVGPSHWTGDARRLTHLRRRFWLLGETLDGQRAFDVAQAVRAVKRVDELKSARLWLQGEKRMAGIALFASLFEPGVERLDLWHLPPTLDAQNIGPEFLNVLKVIDMPAAVAMAAERSKVILYEQNPAAGSWKYASDVAAKLKWDEKRIGIRQAPPKP